MDRNWLIRTTQNQILGPVAKQKILEFIEKGALGLNDEVTSGNGYWFALREKDLVEKYIYGDIPQGYNPISESRSVLFKRENPDKTSSINTAPASKIIVNKIPSDDGPITLPNQNDLEFPDQVSLKSHTDIVLSTESGNNSDADTKLPTQNDLEFPDMSIMSTSLPVKPSGDYEMQTVSNPTPVKKEPISNYIPSAGEDIIYPKNEDLDFPDLHSVSQIEKDESLEFTVNLDSTQTIVIKRPKMEEASHIEMPIPAPSYAKKMSMEIEAGEDLLDLTLTIIQPVKEPVKENKISIKREPLRETKEPKEERLLHERRVKASAKKVPVRENREVVSIENASAPLKKRNDNYIFFILIILALIMLAVFFYFREILNKPLPI